MNIDAQTYGAAADALCGAHADAASRQAADAYLQRARQSPEVWAVLCSIVTGPGTPDHVRVFAAQQLCWKVQHDAAAQLTPPQQAALAGQLLSDIASLSGGPHAARTQLGVALCRLAAASAAGAIDVVDAAKSLAEKGAEEVAVELLTLLGEEVEAAADVLSPSTDPTLWSPRVRGPASPSRQQPSARSASFPTSESRRPCCGAAEHPLVAAASKGIAWVLGFLEFAYQRVGAADSLLLCLGLWTQRLACVPPDAVAASPLVTAAVQMASTSGAAADVLCELALLAGSDLRHWQPVVGMVSAQIPAIAAELHSTADAERQLRLARPITSVCISFAPLLLSMSADAVALVGVAADCAAHPNRDVAAVTYPFWSRLRDLCGGAAVELEAVQPHLLRALGGAMQSAARTADDDAGGAELAEFRNEWVDRTLAHLMYLIGPERSWDAVWGAVVQRLSQPQDLAAAEAAVYAMLAAPLRQWLPGAAPSLLSLLRQLPRGTPAAEQLHATASVVLARAAERAGEGAGPLLVHAMQMLRECYGAPGTAASAAAALRRLVLVCTRRGEAASAQMDVLAECLTRSAAMPQKVQDDTAEAFSTALNRLPPECMAPAVSGVCADVLRGLQGALAAGDSRVTGQHLSLLSVILRRASLRGITTSQRTEGAGEAWLPHWQAVSGAVAACVESAPHDDEVVRHGATALRCLIRVLGPLAEPHLPSVADLLLRWARVAPNSGLLEVARTLCMEFPGVGASLAELWACLGDVLLPGLAGPPPFSRQDIAESFFKELAVSVRHLKAELVRSRAAAATFPAALAGLRAGGGSSAPMATAAASLLQALSSDAAFLNASADGAVRGEAICCAVVDAAEASWETCTPAAGVVAGVSDSVGGAAAAQWLSRRDTDVAAAVAAASAAGSDVAAAAADALLAAHRAAASSRAGR